MPENKKVTVSISIGVGGQSARIVQLTSDDLPIVDQATHVATGDEALDFLRALLDISPEVEISNEIFVISAVNQITEDRCYLVDALSGLCWTEEIKQACDFVCMGEAQEFIDNNRPPNVGTVFSKPEAIAFVPDLKDGAFI